MSGVGCAPTRALVPRAGSRDGARSAPALAGAAGVGLAPPSRAVPTPVRFPACASHLPTVGPAPPGPAGTRWSAIPVQNSPRLAFVASIPATITAQLHPALPGAGVNGNYSFQHLSRLDRKLELSSRPKFQGQQTRVDEGVQRRAYPNRFAHEYYCANLRF